MPPLPAPADEYLAGQLRNPARQIGQQGQQQNKTITNASGQPVINEGLIPGSDPAATGWQFVDPSTGNQRMFVGEDGTGNAYIAWYDANGNMTIKIDYQGVHVLNTSGQEESRLGQLSSSPAIYGVGVAPATGSAPGTLQQVGGALSIVNTTGLSSITTSQAIPDTSLTVEIGPSESALVSVGAQVAQGGTLGDYVQVEVYVDGASVGWGGAFFPYNSGGASPSASYQAIMGPATGTTLTPGTHTLSCYATLSAGVTSATISDVTLNIQPL